MPEPPPKPAPAKPPGGRVPAVPVIRVAGPARARPGSATSPPTPAGSPGPSRLAALLSLLVGVGLLVGTSVAAHRLESPLAKLALYGVVIGIFSTVDRLRRGLPWALAAVALGSAALYAQRNADALREGRLPPEQVLDGVVRLATGLGPGGAAAGAPATLSRYRPYLEKLDTRSSEINILAAHLAKPCPGADHLCETTLILRFVTDEVAYRNDPRGGGDYVKTPQETLAANAGDCEDKTILLASLLGSLGVETWMVFTRDHAYPLVCYGRPLGDQLRAVTARMSPEERVAYLRELAPAHDEVELARRMGRAVYFPIDGKACYPLEPTAPGSWIGVYPEGHAYEVAVDAVTGRVVDLSAP